MLLPLPAAAMSCCWVDVALPIPPLLLLLLGLSESPAITFAALMLLLCALCSSSSWNPSASVADRKSEASSPASLLEPPAMGLLLLVVVMVMASVSVIAPS